MCYSSLLPCLGCIQSRPCVILSHFILLYLVLITSINVLVFVLSILHLNGVSFPIGSTIDEWIILLASKSGDLAAAQHMNDGSNPIIGILHAGYSLLLSMSIASLSSLKIFFTFSMGGGHLVDKMSNDQYRSGLQYWADSIGFFYRKTVDVIDIIYARLLDSVFHMGGHYDSNMGRLIVSGILTVICIVSLLLLVCSPSCCCWCNLKGHKKRIHKHRHRKHTPPPSPTNSDEESSSDQEPLPSHTEKRAISNFSMRRSRSQPELNQ